MNNRGARRGYSGRGKWGTQRGGNRRRNRSSGIGKNIEISGVNFFAILAIIGMAVILGFMTTKFIVYPMILGEEATFETDFLSVIAGRGEKDSSGGIGDDGADNVDVSSGGAVTDTGSAGAEGSDKANTGDDDSGSQAIRNPINNLVGMIGFEAATGGAVTADNNSQTQTTAPATADFSGYCLQYGSFSTEQAANELVAELKTSGLTAQVVQKDGAYKVIGQLFKTKDEAVFAKENVLTYASPEYADVFVTHI